MSRSRNYVIPYMYIIDYGQVDDLLRDFGYAWVHLHLQANVDSFPAIRKHYETSGWFVQFKSVSFDHVAFILSNDTLDNIRKS
jgi:hypothetical protein